MAKTKNLVIDQGTSFYANVQYVDDKKRPISLVGYDVQSKMRASYNSSNSATITTVVTDAANGNIELRLTPTQTSAIKSGRYVYDVQANIGSDIVRIVEGLITVYPTASGVSTGSLFTNPQLVSISDEDFTTANIVELTNLFFTNARVQSNVEGILETYAGELTAGNIVVSGAITKSKYNSGEVVNTRMYSNAEINVITTLDANTNTYTAFADCVYTPVLENSYLFVDFTTRYTVSGIGDDGFSSQLAVDGEELSYNTVQYLDGSDGSHHRFGVLFPLMGRYNSSNSSPKVITISLRRNSADDYVEVYDDTSMWLRVTEVAI